MDEEKRPLGIMTKFNDFRGTEHRRLLVGYDRAKRDMSSLQFVNPPEPGIFLIDLPNEALDIIVPAHAADRLLLDLSKDTVAVLKRQYEGKQGPFANMPAPAIA